MTEQLEVAVRTGRVDVVQSFLSTLQESKENDDLLDQVLKQPCFDGETLLHLASREDKFDIVRTLLVTGADPSVRDKDGKLSYDVAASDKTQHVFRESLLQAVSQSNIPQLEQLVKSGVSVNFIDSSESQNTPLHWGASYGDAKTVECLCRYGADVGAINAAGCSPLHDAIGRGNVEITECLLRYGADPSLQIAQGRLAGLTGFDQAMDKPEVLTLLNNPPPLVDLQNTELLNSLEAGDGDKRQPSLMIPNGTVQRGDGVVSPAPSDSSVAPQLLSPVFKPKVLETSRPPHVVTEEKLSRLWPQPQSIEQQEGPPFHIRKPDLPVIVSVATGTPLREIKKCFTLHKSKFESVGLQLALEPFTPLSDLDDPHIVCCVSQRLCPAVESYKLNVMQNQIKILCHSCESLHHAISTLLQLLKMYHDEEKKEIKLPQLRIDDWPDLPYRGILFDISQGRVPNMETIRETLQTLSSLKINQIHL